MTAPLQQRFFPIFLSLLSSHVSGVLLSNEVKPLIEGGGVRCWDIGLPSSAQCSLLFLLYIQAERDTAKGRTLTSSVAEETLPVTMSWRLRYTGGQSPLFPAPLVLTCGRHPLLRIHPQCPRRTSRPGPAHPALPDRG